MPTELPLLPGVTLGMLGGGQLGRMFTIAARTMGYQVMVLDPDPASPAGQLADVHVQADYSDHGALRKMAEACAAITTEFENIPAASLNELARYTRVAPVAEAVAIVQDRSREKSWLRDNGFATAPFALVGQADELELAAEKTGLPAILKVSRFGYDGKGQFRVGSISELRAAFAETGSVPCVLEGFVNLEGEISVVLARTDSGECRAWPVGENRHDNGVLDISIVPARVPENLAQQAREMAMQIAAGLNYVGVMAVEFFVSGGQLLVNEIAPRPHNSGHYTLDACVTDQFEQQVRALCGLPLGDTRLLSPVVMVNILGDRWQNGGLHWELLLSHANVKLHLYGKQSARPGRKMGHFNVLDESLDQALNLAETLREKL